MLPYHQGTKDTKKHEGVRPEAARTRVYLFVSLGALCLFVVRFPVALRPLSPCRQAHLRPAENGLRLRNHFCASRLHLRRVPGTRITGTRITESSKLNQELVFFLPRRMHIDTDIGRAIIAVGG